MPKIKGLAAIFSLAMLVLPTSACFAGDIVVVDGQRYEQSGGKLYPQVKHEWEEMNGTVHTDWITDYSSWRAPVIKDKDLSVSQPKLNASRMPAAKGNVKMALGGAADEKPLSASDAANSITSRDEGCKHYLTIGADMLFDFDKSSLTANAEKVLRVLGPMLQKFGAHPVIIEGHTDAIGTDEYNQTLSEQRAQTVRDWLVGHGFLSDAATIKGYGKSHPVAANTYNDGTDYPQGRAKNRRVEVYVNTCE